MKKPYEKSLPNIIQVKYEYDKEFFKLNISAKRGRPSTYEFSIKQAYTSHIPMSSAKYNDLQKLCTKSAIPKQHHEYFKSLPQCSTVRDCIAGDEIADD